MKNITITLITLMTLAGGAVFSQEKDKSKEKADKKMTTKELTTEQRKSMADVHEKIAACLRSGKTMSDCRSEMRTNCQQMMGDEDCPMMGMMGDGYMMRKNYKKDKK